MKKDTSGIASWEEPKLSTIENIQKNWRNLIVHLWGPAGSLVFHIVAIGVLISLTTASVQMPNDPPIVDIITNYKEEKIDPPPQEIIKQETKPIELPVSKELPETLGQSTVQTTEPIGGANNQSEGVGLGTDDPSNINKGFEIDVQVQSRLKMKGLFSQRTSGGIQGALGLYNKDGIGGEATEAAVLKALRWLKKEQLENGSWKGEKINATPAMTSFALLAYLAHGEKPDSIEFGQTVKKAIKWLIDNQEPNGHFKGKDGNDYSQPIAAYALCEAYGLTQHPEVKEVAIKAISEIVKGQHSDGGFDYKLAQDNRNDSSYMAWCCQALKAAKMAGLTNDVPAIDSAIKKAIAGFKQNADPNGGFGYTGKGRSGLSGAGAVCLQLLGNPTAIEVKNTIKFLEPCTFSFNTPDQQPYGGGSQLYYWYYITQAKFHYSLETFTAWNKLFSPELVKQQIIEKNAIEDAKGNKVDIGHWTSPCKNEHSGGLVQDTALCTLMLEVYYRYLPSFKHIENPTEILAKNEEPKDIIENIKIK